MTGPEPVRLTQLAAMAGIKWIIALLRPVDWDRGPAPRPSTHNVPRARLFVGVLILTSACRDPVFSDMSDSTYVRTMVALRKLPVGQTDTTFRARQRDSILKAFGVTAVQLESTTARLAGDPARAVEIWRAIESPRPASPP
jgi:hypothetical protein